MARGRVRKKSDKSVDNDTSGDQNSGTAKDNRLVSLSTLGRGSLASQDKRTNDVQSTENTNNNTNNSNTETILSLSHKKGKLKQERYVLVKCDKRTSSLL